MQYNNSNIIYMSSSSCFGNCLYWKNRTKKSKTNKSKTKKSKTKISKTKIKPGKKLPTRKENNKKKEEREKYKKKPMKTIKNKEKRVKRRIKLRPNPIVTNISPIEKELDFEGRKAKTYKKTTNRKKNKTATNKKTNTTTYISNKALLPTLRPKTARPKTARPKTTKRNIRPVTTRATTKLIKKGKITRSKTTRPKKVRPKTTKPKTNTKKQNNNPKRKKSFSDPTMNTIKEIQTMKRYGKIDFANEYYKKMKKMNKEHLISKEKAKQNINFNRRYKVVKLVEPSIKYKLKNKNVVCCNKCKKCYDKNRLNAIFSELDYMICDNNNCDSIFLKPGLSVLKKKSLEKRFKTPSPLEGW